MQSIIDRLNNLFFGSDNTVEGFVLEKGSTQSLVMTKKGDKYWSTEWVDNKMQVVQPEGKTIQDIFKQNV